MPGKLTLAVAAAATLTVLTATPAFSAIRRIVVGP